MAFHRILVFKGFFHIEAAIADGRDRDTLPTPFGEKIDALISRYDMVAQDGGYFRPALRGVKAGIGMGLDFDKSRVGWRKYGIFSISSSSLATPVFISAW